MVILMHLLIKKATMMPINLLIVMLIKMDSKTLIDFLTNLVRVKLINLHLV